MESVLLAAMIDFVPAILLLYMGIQIFLRNRGSLHHFLAFATMMLCAFGLLGRHVLTTNPSYMGEISAWWVLPAILLAVCTGMHFYLAETHLDKRFPAYAIFAYSYSIIILYILFLSFFDWRILRQSWPVIMNQSSLSMNFLWMIIGLSLIMEILYIGVLIWALRNSGSRKSRAKYGILLAGALLLGVWVLAVIFVLPHLSVYLLNGSIIWMAAIWVAMVKFDFLPSYEQRYKFLFELSPSGIVLLNRDGIIREANPSAHALMDKEIGELKGESVFSYISPDSRSVLQPLIAASFAEGVGRQNAEMGLTQENGMELTVLSDMEFMDVGGEQTMFVMFRDITAEKQAVKQIAYMAYHDQLTGLLNRAEFVNRVEKMLETAEIHPLRAAVLLIDLDRFKQLNDSFGHQAGDRLLQKFSIGIRQLLRTGDTVARLGGDEFVILLPHVESIDMVKVVCERIIEFMSRPFHVEGREFEYSGSIGVCLFPQDGGNAEQLIKNADIAMYQAKADGRGRYAFYSPEMTLFS